MTSSYERELWIHSALSLGMIFLSIPTFLILQFVIPSPFGKTLPKNGFGTGIIIPARSAWMMFEAPNLCMAALCFYRRNEYMFGNTNAVLLLLFCLHYINRCVIYPLRMSGNSKPVPLEVFACALLFTTINGYLQAQNLCQFQSYPPSFMQQFQFLLGIIIFLVGFQINFQSDSILLSLQKQRKALQQQKYLIPHGGLFTLVSAPHYFGEIIEWIGFAIACDSLSAWAFVIYTAANLIPRGYAHHQWYKNQFQDYPPNRKAVIPFVL